jgi:hypothetical protein
MNLFSTWMTQQQVWCLTGSDSRLSRDNFLSGLQSVYGLRLLFKKVGFKRCVLVNVGAQT